MKKKKAKAKKQKIKKEIVSYPKQLQLEEYFKCPIWFADEPAFVDDLNKASDKYIEESKKNLKPLLINVIKNLVTKVIWVMYFIQHH
jgi:hypothetical protein